ncbi:MAG: 16S rRNA (guanine(527)-N(7))-methyltransferase RsmG [Candidatus Kapaibacterium sp.]|nr:16S rRNA (guanine(527)-N(7))-methyltransferase RsmG [Bacteroidota bacterium]
MDKLEFWTVCSANGIVLEKEQVDLVERYHRDLLYWNKQVNLISRKDEEHILVRHILHSMALLTQVEIPQRAHCLDIGTGGGFPGLPVKIARPDITMLLADSIAKKIKMTEMFAKHTELKKVSAVNIRVEELAAKQKYSWAFDVIMARAVAPIGELVKWTRLALKPNGFWVFLKGGNLDEEIEQAVQQFPMLQVDVRQISMHGVPWFQEQDKKVVIAKFKRNS